MPLVETGRHEVACDPNCLAETSPAKENAVQWANRRSPPKVLRITQPPNCDEQLSRLSPLSTGKSSTQPSLQCPPLMLSFLRNQTPNPLGRHVLLASNLIMPQQYVQTLLSCPLLPTSTTEEEMISTIQSHTHLPKPSIPRASLPKLAKPRMDSNPPKSSLTATSR